MNPADQLLHGVAPLDHLGVLRVHGADAIAFLQGQLTNDFALLGNDAARLAAFCSAKGRMQASFIGWRAAGDTDDVLLVCSRDLLEPVRRRLSMFVLRAKVRLDDATDGLVLRGLAGSAALQALGGGAADAWSRVGSDSATAVVLHPADGVARALWCAPAGAAEPAGALLAAEAWRWGDVRSGVATVTAAVADAFVPQMLNYESVGGVNFKKGCYPGQEVVARSQFRGTLKRRGYLLHAQVPLAAGDTVWQHGQPDEPCGSVAQAAAVPTGAGDGFDAIASLQVAAAAMGDLRLGAADGPPLALLPLPYPLLADV